MNKEEKMLEILTEYATWRGRYFIAASPPERRMSHNNSDKAVQIGPAHSQANLEMIDSLYERLYALYAVERGKSSQNDK